MQIFIAFLIFAIPSHLGILTLTGILTLEFAFTHPLKALSSSKQQFCPAYQNWNSNIVKALLPLLFIIKDPVNTKQAMYVSGGEPPSGLVYGKHFLEDLCFLNTESKHKEIRLLKCIFLSKCKGVYNPGHFTKLGSNL